MPTEPSELRKRLMAVVKAVSHLEALPPEEFLVGDYPSELPCVADLERHLDAWLYRIEEYEQKAPIRKALADIDAAIEALDQLVDPDNTHPTAEAVLAAIRREARHLRSWLEVK